MAWWRGAEQAAGDITCRLIQEAVGIGWSYTFSLKLLRHLRRRTCWHRKCAKIRTFQRNAAGSNSIQGRHSQTSSTHSSMQLHSHQPLEDMIDWTTLQQLGWRFMQEVANKFNCFSLSTQKGLWLIIQWVLCRPCGESNICHLFKAHQLTGNQVTNTLWFHVSIRES